MKRKFFFLCFIIPRILLFSSPLKTDDNSSCESSCNSEAGSDSSSLSADDSEGDDFSTLDPFSIPEEKIPEIIEQALSEGLEDSLSGADADSSSDISSGSSEIGRSSPGADSSESENTGSTPASDLTGNTGQNLNENSSVDNHSSDRPNTEEFRKWEEGKMRTEQSSQENEQKPLSPGEQRNRQLEQYAKMIENGNVGQKMVGISKLIGGSISHAFQSMFEDENTPASLKVVTSVTTLPGRIGNEVLSPLGDMLGVISLADNITNMNSRSPTIEDSLGEMKTFNTFLKASGLYKTDVPGLIFFHNKKCLFRFQHNI